MTLLDRIREWERWVWRRTIAEPWWNFVTWLGHAAVCAACVGVAAIPLIWGYDFREYGAAAGIGYYLIRELVDLYRGKPVPANWPKFWRVLDPIMDVVSPLLVGVWLA
jgi:hypothetical protein